MHYNFFCKHQTLKTTPAVAAGVSSHIWKMEDVIAMMERLEAEHDSN
jgi:hypothetical protein